MSGTEDAEDFLTEVEIRQLRSALKEDFTEADFLQLVSWGRQTRIRVALLELALEGKVKVKITDCGEPAFAARLLN